MAKLYEVPGSAFTRTLPALPCIFLEDPGLAPGGVYPLGGGYSWEANGCPDNGDKVSGAGEGGGSTEQTLANMGHRGA